MNLRVLPILTLLLTAACSGPLSRILPPSGRVATEVGGNIATLRVYALPPGQLPDFPGVLAVYVELKNRGGQSLRVTYPDLWIGDGHSVRLYPLRPGDVLRPRNLAGGQRRLLASLTPSVLFGRQPPGEPTPRPETLSDWNSSGSGLDFFSPTARSKTNPLWVMRNDYDSGMQLTTVGWNFFGLPRSGDAMSLFDVLRATMPDGVILPGGVASGILFFPASAAAFVQRGLHWDVHDALGDQRVEALSLPLSAER